MNFNEYQSCALKTANETSALTNWALGLCGETGEVAEIIKKNAFHGHELDRKALCNELGDALWYLAVMADGLGFDLDWIAQQNVAKLKARYPDGFSEERSQNRD